MKEEKNMGVFGHFFDAVKNHYADFDGTATREQIWMYLLGYILATIPLAFFAIAIEAEALLTLLDLVLFLPSIAIMARRLHDRNMSGWWQLVPLLGFVVMFLPSYKNSKILKKYGGTMEGKTV